MRAGVLDEGGAEAVADFELAIERLLAWGGFGGFVFGVGLYLGDGQLPSYFEVIDRHAFLVL